MLIIYQAYLLHSIEQESLFWTVISNNREMFYMCMHTTKIHVHTQHTYTHTYVILFNAYAKVWCQDYSHILGASGKTEIVCPGCGTHPYSNSRMCGYRSVRNNIPQPRLLPIWRRADVRGLLRHRQCAGWKKEQTYKMFKWLDGYQMFKEARVMRVVSGTVGILGCGWSQITTWEDNRSTSKWEVGLCNAHYIR